MVQGLMCLHRLLILHIILLTVLFIVILCSFSWGGGGVGLQAIWLLDGLGTCSSVRVVGLMGLRSVSTATC